MRGRGLRAAPPSSRAGRRTGRAPRRRRGGARRGACRPRRREGEAAPRVVRSRSRKRRPRPRRPGVRAGDAASPLPRSSVIGRAPSVAAVRAAAGRFGGASAAAAPSHRAVRRAAPGGHRVRERDVLRQADLPEVVALLHRAPGGGAQRRHRLRLRQGPHHGRGDGVRREEVHQQAVRPVLDHLLHRGGGGADDEAAAAHRFQHRPGQDEGIGQVDVRGRQAEEVEQRPVRHLAREVDALQGQAPVEFGQQRLLPGAAAGRLAAVVRLVAADQHDMRRRAAGEDLRQAAHEGREAAIGLQAAGDEGHHLVAAAERPAVGEGEARLLAPADRMRVHALVHHRHPRLRPVGEAAALPLRRGLAPIRLLQRHQVGGVQGAHPAGVVDGDLARPAGRSRHRRRPSGSSTRSSRAASRRATRRAGTAPRPSRDGSRRGRARSRAPSASSAARATCCPRYTAFSKRRT